MPGVRLHHPTLRNVTYTITNYAVRLVIPMFCASCSGGPEGDPATPRSVVHEFKTLHLNIDALGDVWVHEGIFELMERNGLIEDLQPIRTKGAPPPQVIGFGGFQAVTVDRERGVLNGQLRK